MRDGDQDLALAPGALRIGPGEGDVVHATVARPRWRSRSARRTRAVASPSRRRVPAAGELRARDSRSSVTLFRGPLRQAGACRTVRSLRTQELSPFAKGQIARDDPAHFLAEACGVHAPHPHRAIPAAGRQSLAVRAEGDGGDRDQLATERLRVGVEGREVPKLHRAVAAASGKGLPIATKRECIDRLGLAGEASWAPR